MGARRCAFGWIVTSEVACIKNAAGLATDEALQSVIGNMAPILTRLYETKINLRDYKILCHHLAEIVRMLSHRSGMPRVRRESDPQTVWKAGDTACSGFRGWGGGGFFREDVSGMAVKDFGAFHEGFGEGGVRMNRLRQIASGGAHFDGEDAFSD